jgi:probable addiction module antidote protein
MALKTTRFDVQDYLKTPKDRAAYLEAAFADGDPALITRAIGDIARARGMTTVAKEAGVTRQALYRALSEDGDPRLSTLVGVLKALGIHLSAAA